MKHHKNLNFCQSFHDTEWLNDWNLRRAQLLPKIMSKYFLHRPRKRLLNVIDSCFKYFHEIFRYFKVNLWGKCEKFVENACIHALEFVTDARTGTHYWEVRIFAERKNSCTYWGIDWSKSKTIPTSAWSSIKILSPQA